MIKFSPLFKTILLWEVKKRTDVLIAAPSSLTMDLRLHVIVLLERIFVVQSAKQIGKEVANKSIKSTFKTRSALAFYMNTTDFTHKLIGKYTNIDRIDFPLEKLEDIFTKDDLSFIFGENFNEDNYLRSLENSRWYTHLLFRLNSNNKIVGYLELIKVRDEVEIHGGGTNNSFIEKIARTEAWYLIIKYCFETFKVNSIETSCRVENEKAYNLITGTGFKEIGKNEKGDCFKFNLSHEDFLTNRIFNMMKLLNNNKKVKI